MISSVYNTYVKPYLTEELPSIPGLYLYVKEEQDSLYYYVDFVNVNFRKDLNCLVADSNTWYTYFPVHHVEKEVGPGKWTKQITLGN